jgi:hypothetical protein
LIRGHWDYGKKSESIDFEREELEAVNMGMAIVTPIQELFAMLNSEEFTAERGRHDLEVSKEQSPTN